jgi:hypothetical protein
MLAVRTGISVPRGPAHWALTRPAELIRYCRKIVMDEMTLISMNIFHIEVNHFKYEIIWQNKQEKISDICLLFGSEYPPLGNLPMGGNSASPLTPNWRVPSGRIFQSKPQHMTDIINPSHS